MKYAAAAIMFIGTLVSGAACTQTAVNVFSAGSLRAPLTEIGRQYEAKANTRIIFTFGASGLLKDRIEKGEVANVFTSANTEHPQALATLGLAHPPRVFTRNQLCALSGPGVNVTSETLLDTMLRPDIKLGTSTPRADPAGDYAWKVFEQAERIQPGAFKQLDAKALKLTGGADSPPPPADRNVYGELVANARADIFLTYCTSVLQAIAEQPALRRTALPAALAVAADYGLTVLKRAGPEAQMFADYLLSADAQQVFAKYGFAAPPAIRAAAPTVPAQLSVELPGKPAVKFWLGDLEKLERKTTAVSIQDKGPFKFSGVTLFSILQAAGYSLDQPRRGAYLTQYVLLIASDGYRVVYAMGDFDPKSKRAAPLLAWQQDGTALKESERPYRLIIPDNAHTSRWIRQVERIIVRQVDD